MYECQWIVQQETASLSKSWGVPEANHLPIPLQVKMHLRFRDNRTKWGQVFLMTGLKKLKDAFIDPNVLPKFNISDMAGTMEAIKEYLRSHWVVIQAPLAYVIRKTIKVQTCGDYPSYPTPDNEMIARMLHLPSDKNKIYNEQNLQSVPQHTNKYKIDNRTIYDILDLIC